MVIPSTLVGANVEAFEHEVDERWTMSYAASLGLDQAVYLDTTSGGGVVAHPLFSVCVEWPVIVASRRESERLGVPREEVMTGVHATHDVIVHRLVRPGDVLMTSLEIVGLVSKTPGAMTTTRLTTVDHDAQPVASTTQDAIYLGVSAQSPDLPDPTPPQPVAGGERRGEPREVRIDLPRVAAHVYTEGARIWNPIHTDRAVALAAGLPDIIMHGTANLAYGINAVVEVEAAGRPELVRRVACRFAAMVSLPSTITVRVWKANDTDDGRSTVPFEVLNADGAAAVKDGVIVLGEPDASSASL